MIWTSSPALLRTAEKAHSRMTLSATITPSARKLFTPLPYSPEPPLAAPIRLDPVRQNLRCRHALSGRRHTRMPLSVQSRRMLPVTESPVESVAKIAVRASEIRHCATRPPQPRSSIRGPRRRGRARGPPSIWQSSTFSQAMSGTSRPSSPAREKPAKAQALDVPGDQNRRLGDLVDDGCGAAGQHGAVRKAGLGQSR